MKEFAAGVDWVLSRSDEEWRELSANALATILARSWEQSAKLFEDALLRAYQRSARGEIGGRCSQAFAGSGSGESPAACPSSGVVG